MRRYMSLIFCTTGALALAFMTSCSPAEGDRTGREFMPDMAHSVAYEANVAFDYGPNTWDEESVLQRRDLAQPRMPIHGTIARGYAGASAADVATNPNDMSLPPNGSVPYPYVDTEESRAQAMADILSNPFPITDSGIARGKELYTIYCGICHGEKADGAGYLVRDDGGVYPAQPANLVSADFIAATEGRFYHSIMYGKNVMGGYADKLSYEERWQVIHYIRSLQAAVAKKTYNESENTLTGSAAIANTPAGNQPQQ